MRRLILVVAIALTAIVSSLATLAVAHHGPMHRSVYRQTAGSTWFPQTVVIRCPGWAEDVANELTVVDYSADRVVYRCDLTV